MHELSVTKSIYTIVQKHAKKNRVRRVISVNLEIGALSDLQNEWIQRYFDHLSEGTIIEGAKLNITRVPAVFRCNQCLQLFDIVSLLEEELLCQYCRSRNVYLISGKEYTIKNMEAE
jgi:hydrogenase nickel incorporation protein HypA/HybF